MSTNSDREMRSPVRTFMVRLRCAKCADGEMASTGFSQPTSPMRYGHRCDKCGAEEWISGKSYPSIEHEEERGFVA